MSGTSDPPELTTEILDRRDQLEPVREAWRALAVCRGNAFVTPEWFDAWFAAYGAGSRPAVIVSRRPDGSVAGLIPFVRAGRGRSGVLRFAGDNLGDVFHPASMEADEPQVIAGSVRALTRARRPLGVVLERIDQDSKWSEVGSAAGLRPQPAYRFAVLPWADVGGGDFEDYLSNKSRNFRSQVRRKSRVLVDELGARFRLTQNAAELDRDIESFFRLHEQRWGQRGGSRALTENSRAFHRDFARRALNAGWLRLWNLEIDDEPVASWYGWKLGDRYSYYQAGFAPRWSRHSVGFVLLAHTVRQAIEERAAVYDLLLGDDEYKSRFATGERRVETVVLTHGWRPRTTALKLEGGLWRLRARMPRQVRGPVDQVLASARSSVPRLRRR